MYSMTKQTQTRKQEMSNYTHEIRITDPNRNIEDGMWSEHSREDLARKELDRMRKMASGGAAHMKGVTFRMVAK
jgi:hypothetical protein